MSSPDLSKLQIDRSAKSFGPRRRPRWIKWAVIAAVVAALAAAFAWRGANAPLSVDAATVTTAYPSQGFTLLNATGRVVAQRKAAVSTKATGRLEWLGVQEGSRVKAGEVIARLESLDVSAARDSSLAAVKAARANLEQGEAERRDAEVALKRATDLYEKKFIAESALDAARARHEKAVAAIASLKAAIGVAEANARSAAVTVEQTLIRAPFDGIVLTKNANVGDIITPFSSATDSKGAVVNMADMDTLEVEADVSESSLAIVSVGQPCEIQLDALPQTRLRGQVANMVPSVDRSKATVTFKIRLVEHDERVLPEMSAKVAFLSRELRPDERQPRLALNPAALAGSPPTQAWVLADGKLQRRKVLTGTRLGDYLEIRSGLKLGERVVMHPSTGLKDGASAREAEK